MISPFASILLYQSAWRDTVIEQILSLHVSEQILVGRTVVVNHSLLKFKDGVGAGITFDREIRIQIKMPFIS